LPSNLFSFRDVILTESDLACIFFFFGSEEVFEPVSLDGRCLPMRPFLVAGSFPLGARVGIAVAGVRGVPGDVGGRESGAELMEWDARVWEKDLGGGASGKRVFVKVIVTENCSPAK
jgi:hypothetical protein